MKLNQVIAIEKGVKERASQAVANFNKIMQHGNLAEGFIKTYTPREENGEDLPPETKRVQFKVDDIVQEFSEQLTELFDVTANKDWTNTEAVADVRIGDNVLLEKVPSTYLLFLEKQLDKFQEAVQKVPVLDPAVTWQWDEKQGFHRTSAITKFRTRKVQRPLVLYDATDKHPAQTQLITEDETVGTWEEVRYSGATSTVRKKQLLRRIDTLRKSVKVAREEANNSTVQPKEVGQTVFTWLLAE